VQASGLVAGRLARIWDSFGRALSRFVRASASVFGEARGAYGRAKTFALAGRAPPPYVLPSRSGGEVDGGERREEDIRPVIRWTYESIRAARVLADDGEMRYVADLCEMLMGDERISSKLEDRALSLSAAPIQFEIAPKGRQRRAAKRAAEAEQDWWDMVPETELGLMLKWYRLLGIAIAELVWTDPIPLIPIANDGHGNWYVPNVAGRARLRNGRNVPRLKWWHPRALRWDWQDRCWYVRLDGGYEERVEPGNGKWVMWSVGARPWINGLWRGLSVVWLLKALAGPAWGRQGERHANGTAIMSGPEAYDQELRRQLTREWRELGSSGVIWVPEGSKLEIFELQANTWQTYKGQIDTANTAIDIAIMGANLPTEASQGAGTGATAQMETVQKRVEGDAREWETIEHDQIARPWAKANFGTPDVAPYAIRMVKPANDVTKLATAQKAAAEGYRLLRGENAPFDEVAYLRQYEIPISEARIGQRSKATVFAWHITSSMLSYGEARARYDDTLPPSPWDALRFADVSTGGSFASNADAVAAFQALAEALPANEDSAPAQDNKESEAA
jgi:hypothetical protein